MRLDLSAALCAGLGAAVSSVVAQVRSRDAAVTRDPDPRGCERCRLLTHAGCAWGLEQTCANPSPWCWPQPDETCGLEPTADSQQHTASASGLLEDS